MKAATAILVLLLAMSCLEKKLSLEVLDTRVLHEVPGGSGIIKAGEHYYIIGDNSPFLYKTDSSFRVISKIPIYANKDSVIPKHLKPDFEAIENIKDEEIIVFGSGSKSPVRDVFLRIFLKDNLRVKTYSISGLYSHLKSLKELENKELNIEAAAYSGDRLYLFNRKPNLIFMFFYADLIKYVEGEAGLPDIEIMIFKLPSINGIEAGFSGAAAYKDIPRIYFTASVENTPNAYDDGEILGSFAGSIEIIKNKLSDKIQYALLNTPSPVKVESVAVEKMSSPDDVNLVLVTDSDGKESLVYRCRLKPE